VYSSGAEPLGDLVEGVGSEVDSSAVDDEVVAIHQDAVVERAEDGVAKCFARVVLVDGGRREGEGLAAKVGEEGDVDANVEPVSREDVDALANRTEHLRRRKI